MKKFSSYLFFSVLLFNSTIASSQQSNVDSLIRQLSTTKLHDTIKLKLYGDIAWELMSNNINQSHDYATKALDLAKQLNRKADIAQAESDLGSVLNRMGNYKEAILHYKEAISIRIKLNQDNRVAGIYSNISTIYIRQGNYAEALEINMKALKIVEKLNDKAKQSVITANIGEIYYELDKRDLSEIFLKKGLELAIKSDDFTVASNILVSLGNIKFNESVLNDTVIIRPKKLDSALNYFMEAEKIFIANNLQYNLSAVYNNIGRIYMIQHKYEKALSYYFKSLKDRENLQDKFGIGMSLLNLGTIEKLTGNNEKSIAYFKQCADIFQELKSYSSLKQVYGNLATVYEEKKDYLTALKYYHLYTSCKDSVYNEMSAEKIAQMQTQFETEKKEIENKRLEQLNEINKLELSNKSQKLQQRNQQLIILITSVLFLVVLVFWQRNRIRLRKQVEEIETTKRIQVEKEKISRDLHDSVGGQLSYILYSLEGEASLKDNPISKKISETVKNVISDLRQTIWAMSDDKLSLQSMSDKLKIYARNLLSNKGVKIVFEENIPEEYLDSSIKILNLFRACQEIINNAFKHANCSSLSVKISYVQKIEIEISDDGIGISNEKTKTDNYGLANIKHRVKELNGELSIQSVPGNTCFKISV